MIEVQYRPPVDAQEGASGQPRLQGVEREIGEHLAPGDDDRHQRFAELCMRDIRGIEQQDPLARLDRQPPFGGPVDAGFARGDPPAGALDSHLEARGVHGLQEVIDRADVEGREGVLGVRGAEDHVRSRLGEEANRLQPGEARHLDVEQEHVNRLLAQGLGHGVAAVALTDDDRVVDPAEQAAQAAARELFVIDDQDTERRHRGGSGSRRSTWVRSPSPAIVRRARLS